MPQHLTSSEAARKKEADIDKQGAWNLAHTHTKGYESAEATVNERLNRPEGKLAKRKGKPWPKS